MKKLFLKSLTTLVILSLQVGSVAQFTISEPVSVTDGDDGFGYQNPRLAQNASGEPIVFWLPTSSESFFISTLSNGDFSDPAQIPFNGLDPDLWGGSLGPNMAANGDHVYVTFEVYGQAIYVSHSGDGGLTWDAPVEAFVPPTGRKATIPIIAVDSDGQPYVAYVNTNNSEQDAYYGLVKSLDFGATFSDEVEASSASNEEVCECCNGHIAVADNGDVYVSYRNNEANLRDIWLAKSTDGGNTFESAYDVDETDWTLNGCPSNGPHFAFAGDQIVTSFYSGVGPEGSGVYSSTFDMLQSTVGSTNAVPASDISSGGQNRPRIVASGDTLAIVWQETFQGSSEIGMSISTTGASGLTMDAFRLTDESTTQRYPDVLLAGGSFHVVYEDPSSGTVMYQEVSFGSVDLEESSNTQFTIGPNPCSDYVIIQNENYPYQLTLTNQLPQVVVSRTVNSPSYQLNVNNYPSGIYYLNMKNGETSNRTILIVE